jgi:agmatine deiminase
MTITRRSFLAATGIGAATLAVGCRPAQESVTAAAAHPVPIDTLPHERTWMAWPSDASIWGRWLQPVQRDIGRIATTVARFEPVTLCATDSAAAADARAECGPGVTVLVSIPVDDCWMRDSGPVFRLDGRGGLDTIGLNFNGWGSNQTHDKDRSVAELVARHAGVPFSAAGFVGEGGAIVADGDGTVMATESSLVNRERNPGMTKAQVEEAVLAAYGAKAMLWLPGVADRDITDDHVDATSRFVQPGVVMVQRPPAVRTDVWAEDARAQFDILSQATDAKGRRLRVIEVEGPDAVRSNDPGFVDSYVNYYACNGGLIMPEFGDTAKDEAARATVARAFPGRMVVAPNYDALALGGGGVHCVTQQEPRASQ